jgi:hypothetical protein
MKLLKVQIKKMFGRLLNDGAGQVLLRTDAIETFWGGRRLGGMRGVNAEAGNGTTGTSTSFSTTSTVVL